MRKNIVLRRSRMRRTLCFSNSLPKARQRTSVSTKDYVPRDRLFGGFTTRGAGITNATFRYPDVASAIHTLAATRPKGFTAEPYLCAQLNAASSLPLHKDRNNFSRSWLLGLGSYEGGSSGQKALWALIHHPAP